MAGWLDKVNAPPADAALAGVLGVGVVCPAAVQRLRVEADVLNGEVARNVALLKSTLIPIYRQKCY